jgi:CRISPR system Cascade subunit CasB
MENERKPNTAGFVNFLTHSLKNKNNAAMRAAFRGADNPQMQTRSRCLECLQKYCDLDNSGHLEAFCLIGAAIAREEDPKLWKTGIGKAIRLCYKDKYQNNADAGGIDSPESLRLRRLLACRTSTELCAVLRPLLRFIQSKGIKLDYTGLLNDLVTFDRDEKWKEKIKLKWAKDFYSAYEEEGEEAE